VQEQGYPVDVAASTAEITARSGTLVNRAIFLRSPSGSDMAARHSRMSGWMPMDRSSLTECCVGLVLISPDVEMYGTSVRWMNSGSRARAPRPSGVSPRGRQGLDVTHGAADLDHRHVSAATAEADAALDLVRDVRDDLDGAAEVVAVALLADDVS